MESQLDEIQSQCGRQVTTLESKLKRVTDNATQLQTALDSCCNKYETVVKHSASLEAEIERLRQQLSSSFQQVN